MRRDETKHCLRAGSTVFSRKILFIAFKTQTFYINSLQMAPPIQTKHHVDDVKPRLCLPNKYRKEHPT